MFYINLRNGTQHTVPSDITTSEEALAYAVHLFGGYNVVEVINENTGE